MDCYMATALWK